MESAKPIEAGCKAMIICCSNLPDLNGAIVAVISLDGVFGGKYWTDGRTWKEWKIKSSLYGIGHVAEKILMRIDDPDIQHQIEEETKIPVFASISLDTLEAMKRVRQKYEI